jgi:hypothetical protein
MCKVLLGYVLPPLSKFSATDVDMIKGMPLMRAIYWGRNGARENYHIQISTIVHAAHSSLDEAVPVIIGECGIPMDMK